MSMPIEPDVAKLAKGKNFAAFTTLLPSGYPMNHVMWVDCDDDHILINTEVDRQKYKNVERDPRVSVAIVDREVPYRFAEVRGDVVEMVTGDEARRHIDELSLKYTGQPYDAANIKSERVILKILPKRQILRG
jgi:PPOX class probable F420-dependent enzyme